MANHDWKLNLVPICQLFKALIIGSKKQKDL
jgi:hypothetical protein